MKALILVAGHGSRLRSAIGDLPKSLLEIGNKPLLDRQIELMKELGIERICLATGYRHQEFTRRYGDSVDYRFNPFYRDGNNMVSFLFARDWVSDSEVIVCYGDLLYEREVLAAAIRSSADIGLVIDRDRVEQGHALVSLNDGRIADIGITLPPEEAYARFVGITKYSRQGLSQMLPALESAAQADKLHDYYLVGVQSLIDEGFSVAPIDVTGNRWIEIDFPEDLAAARRDWS